MDVPSLPFVPFELIMSILLLLPAKALIKFLAACKTWYSLIKEQEFIKKHLETSVATGKNYILYVPVQSKPEKTFTLLNEKNFRYESELRVPFDLPGMLNCIVVSSFNGLICLTDISRFGHNIYLTNPSINKYLMLPPSNIYFDELDLQIIQVSVGFGYHKKTDDYKVVRIGFVDNDDYNWFHREAVPSTPPHGYDFISKAEVFSLNTRAWKVFNLDPFPYKRHDMFSGVVVNECLHWKAVKSNNREDEMIILSFHLGEETFQEIGIPNLQNEGGIDLTECIGEFKGKLCLFAFCPVFDYWFGLGEQPCHLWVMEEYGVKDSWTCHATVSLGMMIQRPLAFTSNGEIIMQDRFGRVFCYNFNTNQLVDMHIRADEHDLSFVNFTDSLILLDFDQPLGQEGAFPGGAVDFNGYMHIEEVNMDDKDEPPGNTSMDVED